MLPENSTDPVTRMEARREHVSEAFHSFNQPLTALHCGLELCLLKERTGEEYRHRIEDALGNAGTVLQLSKAVRELVEAVDPGEELQRVELHSLFSALSEGVSVVAEAAVVALKWSCPEQVAVLADPEKLARHLGNLASIVTRTLEPGGQLQLDVLTEASHVVIAIGGKGKRRDVPDDDLQNKLDRIRIDAACCYAWTLGGEFRNDRSSFAMRLDALK